MRSYVVKTNQLGSKNCSMSHLQSFGDVFLKHDSCKIEISCYQELLAISGVK